MIPQIDTREYDRLYSTLVTPYRSDSLEVDEEAFRRLVRQFTQSEDFIRAGGALIINPEAGEIFYLTEEERSRLLTIAMEERPEGMPVFAGCFGVRRDAVVASAMAAAEHGVDGIFVMPPVGTMEVSTVIDAELTPGIWVDHVTAVAEATQLPLIIHAHHPWTRKWGNGLPLSAVKAVVEAVPSIVGWKMIYGNAAAHFHVARYLRSLDRHVGIFNAPYTSVHTALIADYLDGAVQGWFNYNAEDIVAHLLAWREGDIDKVKEIWNNRVMPIQEYVQSGHSRLHARYKVATWIRGNIPHPFMRPPMPPPTREEVDSLFRIIGEAGLSRISEDELNEVWDRREAILGS